MIQDEHKQAQKCLTFKPLPNKGRKNGPLSHGQREKLICEDTWCQQVSRNKASVSSHEPLRLPQQQRLQKSHLSVHLQKLTDILFQLQKNIKPPHRKKEE